MLKSLLGTASAEFVSRGLLWARVLVLGTLMPVEGYGFVLVLLGIEGLVAAVTAYPSVKDILVRQDLSNAVHLRFGALFLLVSGPIAIGLWAFTDHGPVLIWVGIVAAFFNALGQIGLFVLRVASLRAHNLTKLAWSVLTTMLFLGLLPLHWAYLPVIYIAGVAVIALTSMRAVRVTNVRPAFDAGLAYHVRGWLIFGVQALVNNFPQFGVRLFIAATMTLTDVALYTQTYMLATALLFVFSAVMINVEPRLSRAATIGEIGARIPEVLRLASLFIALSLAYYLSLRVVAETSALSILLPDMEGLNMALLSFLMIYIALNGLQTLVNCLVLAASGRAVSLLSTVTGSLVMAGGLAATWFRPDLASVGAVMATMQFVVLSILTIALARILSRSGIRLK